MQRVVVFLDYQNAYMQARRCFAGVSAPAQAGQIDPVALGQRLAGATRGLGEVRIYRGLPDARRDRRGHSAARRQAGAWQARDPRIRVLTRPLRYPGDFPRSPPREKGVDVMLAVDFVQMAVQHDYDVGILFSHDTDLVPALEAVVRLRGPRCEVAAWAALDRARTQSLRVPGASLWCHYLTAADYAAVADPRDYTR